MRLCGIGFIVGSGPALGDTLIDVWAGAPRMRARRRQETSMGSTGKALARVAALAACMITSPGGAVSTLDGWPAQTTYLSNDAPFVVFGVTPTQLHRKSQRLRLSFIATDRLSQVNVFPFVRDAPGRPAPLNRPVHCGPRDAGSWDCVVPVAQLLAERAGPGGELGLRIEAHGDPRLPAEHSTVIIQGRFDGNALAPLGAVTVALLRPGLQQPQPAGCLRRW
jgi:hypothetical protein